MRSIDQIHINRLLPVYRDDIEVNRQMFRRMHSLSSRYKGYNINSVEFCSCNHMI